MRLAAIVNPASRNGSSHTLRACLEHRLGLRSHDVWHVSGARESAALVKELIRSGVDTIVAVGGDGTVNAVVNGIVGSSCSLGIIPVGTANDLARSLNIPRQIREACDVIRNGRTRRIDLIRVNGWHYTTAGGIGLPARVVERINRARIRSGLVEQFTRLSGAGAYALAMFYQLLCGSGTSCTVKLRLDRQRFSLNAHALLVSNVSRIGRYMRIAPGAAVDDGMLHVFALAASSSADLAASALRTLTHSPERGVCARLFSGRHLELDAGEPTLFCADGEMRFFGSHLQFDLFPRALQLITPA